MRQLRGLSQRYSFTQILGFSFVLNSVLLFFAALLVPLEVIAVLAIVILNVHGLILLVVWRTLYAIEAEVDKLTQSILSKLEHQQQDLVYLVEAERGHRIAAFARRDSTGELPRRALVLLTVHRSGSTWLVDMLRCHPLIMLDPAAHLIRELQIEGGRYPLGLANGVDADMDFENKPDEGILIPRFQAVDVPVVSADVYALEKIHPQFIADDAQTFLQKVEALEANHLIQLQFVYLVRDPQAVLSSFLNYKQRDPDWYSWLPESDVAEFMRRAYETTLAFARLRKGIVIDYSDLRENPQETLVRIGNVLWPDESQSNLVTYAQAAIDRTARDKRQAKSTAFLGKTEGQVAGGADQHAAFFDRYSDVIEQIYASYHTLLEEFKVR